jgi:diguanylate cyclase (GGDEF)-like protein/PAS domain S-box-containing protein
VKFTIRAKFLVFASLIVLMVGGGISSYLIHAERQMIFELFKKHSLEQADLIRDSLANSLYFLDIASLRNQLSHARVNHEIRQTYVTDTDGVVLTDGTVENSFRNQKLPDSSARKILLADQRISQLDGRILKVGGPVVAPDGHRIGHLYLEFSAEFIDDIARQRVLAGSTATAIFLATGLLLAVIFAASFSRPIVALAKAAEAIGAGELETRVSLPGSDELGMLARSMNRTADSLQQREKESRQAQEELIVAHANLERRVVERTTELSGAREKLQAVLDAATQISIVTTDSQGLITVFNSGAERMLGYRAEEMIGKQTAVILHLESEIMERGRELSEQFGRPIMGFDVFVESARQGNAKEHEWTYVCKNGSHLTVSLAVTALRDVDGKPGGFLGVAKDITERKRTDAELLRFATELDQRIFAAAAANDALQRETEELRWLNEERATLGNLNELLLACASADEAYDIFGRAAAGLFQPSTGALHIYAASRNQLTPAAAWGEWPDALMPFSPESCWGLRRGNYYLGNGTSTPPCEHAGSVQGGATLCVPLMAYGEVLGVLHLRGTDASTLEAKLQLTTIANDGLALTLANIKLRQSLKEQSIRDPLTGLFNRRYLTETLHREFARAQRTGTQVAIVMIDVDHFKRFNDSFGHDAGDAVLKELGTFLRRSVRTDDIACRYGGEEFCLVLPQMDHCSARQRAEVIREGAAALEAKSDGRVLGPVTLSLGVALFPEDGDNTEALVRAADVALYEAKKTGRNRVVMTRAVAFSEKSQLPDRSEQSMGT